MQECFSEGFEGHPRYASYPYLEALLTKEVGLSWGTFL